MFQQWYVHVSGQDAWRRLLSVLQLAAVVLKARLPLQLCPDLTHAESILVPPGLRVDLTYIDQEVD